MSRLPVEHDVDTVLSWPREWQKRYLLAQLERIEAMKPVVAAAQCYAANPDHETGLALCLKVGEYRLPRRVATETSDNTLVPVEE